MYGLISTLPVSPPPVAASAASNSGSVAGVSVTLPTKAPAAIPVPDTDRPSSVITAELSVITEAPAPAVAPASVRGPGTGLPPPSKQVPAGWDGTVCATQLAGRSRKALSPGPGYSSLPWASFISGVFGPAGSLCTVWPNSVSPAESEATEVAAVAGSVAEFAKLLPVKVNGGKPSSKVTSIRPPSLNAGDFSISGMTCSRNRSAAYRPPVKLTGGFGVFGPENPPDRLLPWHTASWASLQLFGEIQLNAGVVFSLCRSLKRPLAGSKRFAMCAALQSPEFRIESNHGNGKCLGTYWSVAFALPGLGWAVLPVGPGWVKGAPQALTPALCGGLPVSGLPRSWA